jgi:hypothetical protein
MRALDNVDGIELHESHLLYEFLEDGRCDGARRVFEEPKISHQEQARTLRRDDLLPHILLPKLY